MIQPDRNANELAHRWSLGALVPLAKTATATLWHSPGTHQVLKVFTKTGLQDEANGTHWLNWAAGQGAVRLNAFTAQAQLLAFCEGPDATDLPDDQATGVICDVIKTFPSDPPPRQLTLLKDRFAPLLNAAPQDHRHVEFAKPLASALLKSMPRICALHGDIHHENILKTGDKWVAIDPKGLTGDPAYDVANLFLNPVADPARIRQKSRIENLVHITSQRLNLSANRIIGFGFAHAALSSLWSIEDGQDPTAALEIADMLKPMAAEARNALFP